MTERNLSLAFTWIALLFTSSMLKAQGWEKLYPNSTLNLYAQKSLLTTDGNYIGLASNIGGQTQAVKTDPQGNLIWNREYGLANGSSFLSMKSITNTNDGGYAMVGSYSFSPMDNGVALYKLDSQGDSLWMKNFGCCSDAANDLIQTSDGGFLVVGFRSLPPFFDTHFAHVIKTDPNGDLLWKKDYFQLANLQNPGFAGFKQIIQRSNGNFLLVGSGDLQVRIVEIDGNGNIVMERIMENPNNQHLIGTSVEETMDGGVIVGGFIFESLTIMGGGCLWKIDANGNLLWMEINALPYDGILSVSENAQGTLFIGRNHFIEKRDANGNIECTLNEDLGRPWSNLYLNATSDGGALVALGIKPFNFSPDYYLGLAKLDSNCLAAVNVIKGNVNVDADGDCIFNGPGAPLNGWLVELNDGQISLFQLTDSAGNYFYNVNPGTYTLTMYPPMSYWEACSPSTINLGPSPDTVEIDLQSVGIENCPFLVVDLASPPMRPCFDRMASITYDNLGPVTAQGVYLQVTLDTLLLMGTASMPYSALPDNAYQFDLGDVEQGEHGQIWFQVQADCSLQLGNTVCMQANIFPDTLCGSQQWNGATIQVQGNCLGDTVLFEIKNIGPADMAMPLEYIVVEDDVMYLQATFDLDADQSVNLELPNNHAIYTTMAQQESGYPFGNYAMDVVSFCQNTNITDPFSTAFFNFFPYGDGAPTEDIECVQVTNAYDPNQKVARPAGFGNEHLIERNTPIEYHIDFQNTGNDTAYNVTIRDTLSAYFDLASFRPGASSHPYQVGMEGQGVLAFRFPNIKLVDSLANEPASRGFVEYKIWQRPGLPLGSVIENSAAIYFDFNAPIITNTVFHTIGENFIIVINDANENPTGHSGLLAYPNPSSGHVNFEITGVAPQDGTFVLHDHLGRVVRTEPVAGNRFRFERGLLLPGIYFYSFENAGAKLYSGKIILR